QLPPRSLATAPPLAARALAPERIAGGWFATVVAVFGQTGLQLLHLRQQPLHLRLKRRHLSFQFGDSFVCCVHGTMLHLHRKPARVVPRAELSLCAFNKVPIIRPQGMNWSPTAAMAVGADQ